MKAEVHCWERRVHADKRRGRGTVWGGGGYGYLSGGLKRWVWRLFEQRFLHREPKQAMGEGVVCFFFFLHNCG